ncbi:hypothetical protein BGY98DRAFT_932332 [Russula aff. rugulosa BPL654]|nr:hypothetical protein BGY98DRAFT_932332 [Russula aff. rugulosa BPL654]
MASFAILPLTDASRDSRIHDWIPEQYSFSLSGFQDDHLWRDDPPPRRDTSDNTPSLVSSSPNELEAFCAWQPFSSHPLASLFAISSRPLSLPPTARAGASLSLVTRTKATLDGSKDAILREHPSAQVLTFPADVRDVKKAGEVVATTVARFGRLDILIANPEATLAGRHEDNSSYLQEVRGSDTDEDSETDEEDTTERIPNNERDDEDEDGTEVEDESEDEAEDENENELEAKDDDEEVMDDDEILNEERFTEL